MTEHTDVRAHTKIKKLEEKVTTLEGEVKKQDTELTDLRRKVNSMWNRMNSSF